MKLDELSKLEYESKRQLIVSKKHEVINEHSFIALILPSVWLLVIILGVIYLWNL